MAITASTIGSPEFINITPKNPLISECEIKVFYLGENRNHSFISKEVAMEMANSLPGCPIVGAYNENKEDFTDHGEKITFDAEGVHFECLTVPYGFVAPDAKIWFQKFMEKDEFGNDIEREYLMTTGYLWTGQFEEAKLAVEEGRPHSMELDEESLEGNWAINNKTGQEFFIINDSIFSKLCILGEDVEPCFEGSTVTAPEVSTSFAKEDKFTSTLFTMMQELKTLLKGEEQMEEKTVKDEFTVEDEVIEVTEVQYKKEDEEEKETQEQKEKDEPSAEDEVENKEKEEKYTFLENSYNDLKADYSLLEKEVKELRAFKLEVENKEKEEMINSFYMLSDEDKREVKENISKYTKDEIEAKLSVICVRKKVNFELEDSKEIENKTEEVPVTTFSLEEQATSVPAWIQAIRNTKNKRDI